MRELAVGVNKVKDKENNRIVKVAVAGLGRSGWANHIHQFRLLPHKYKILAVFDADRKRVTV